MGLGCMALTTGQLNLLLNMGDRCKLLMVRFIILTSVRLKINTDEEICNSVEIGDIISKNLVVHIISLGNRPALILLSEIDWRECSQIPSRCLRLPIENSSSFNTQRQENKQNCSVAFYSLSFPR